MKTNKVQGLKVRAGLKAGALQMNRNRSGLRVKAGVRAGIGIIGFNHNHNSRLVSVG